MTLGLMRGVGDAVALEEHLETKGESFKKPIAGKGSLVGGVSVKFVEVDTIPTCA